MTTIEVPTIYSVSRSSTSIARRAAIVILAVTLLASGLLTVLAPSAAADSTGSVYTTPGKQTVNGRQWRTTCEKYSSNVYRCQADIWATQVRKKPAGTGYEMVHGWAFNNLTYLPSAHSFWSGNPLATPGEFQSKGRKWKTECNNAWTGTNGCRSFIWADVVGADLDRNGNRRFTPDKKWLFNNIVQFGTTTEPPPIEKPQDCALTVEGIQLTIAASQDTVTAVKTSGTRATVTMVERVAGTRCDTRVVFRDTTGRIGYGGVTPAATRRQDTGTTPSGVFTVKDAFGIKSSPWTELAWRNVGPNSYWVLDSKSRYYNQWRDGALGGFNKQNSEHLITYPGEYNYAAVIDYNRSPAIKGKGGAIFLHVHGKGATAGCVSITETNMLAYLQHVAAGDTIGIQ